MSYDHLVDLSDSLGTFASDEQSMATLRELQKLSLQPGGFDNDLNGKPSRGFRKAAWYVPAFDPL